MRRGWQFFFVFILLALFSVLILYQKVLSPSKSQTSVDLSGGNFVKQSVQAGEVMIEARPKLLTPTGFDFEVNFNTHSTDLNLDLKSVARLEMVGGPVLEPLSWSGGQGGHHLSGDLRFPSPGSLTKIIRLKFSSPILGGEQVLEWHL